MRIVKKSEAILFYQMNMKFFDKVRVVECSINGSGQWQLAEDNAVNYVYTLSYFAKDNETNDVFIEYKSLHILTAIIENTDLAVQPTFQFIKESYQVMYSFIKNNSFSNYKELHMPEFEINESRCEIMKGSIDQIKSIQSMNADGVNTVLNSPSIQIAEPEISITVVKNPIK